MSDERQHVKEEESKLTHETDEGDDVEAHNKLAGSKLAGSKGSVARNDEGDDVEAHSKLAGSKLAGSKGSVARNDEGDDDVTAHVKANPN